VQVILCGGGKVEEKGGESEEVCFDGRHCGMRRLTLDHVREALN
jgi:hypothetical protein